MKKQSTPGPWQKHKGLNGWLVFNEKTEMTVASLVSQEHVDLIAASPEMLDVLVLALEDYKEKIAAAEASDRSCHVDKYMRGKIASVIAKAEGRESDEDPSPYCQYCNSKTQSGCHCGPIADNN